MDFLANPIVFLHLRILSFLKDIFTGILGCLFLSVLYNCCSTLFLLPWSLMRNAPLNTSSSYEKWVVFLWLLSKFFSLIFSSLIMIWKGLISSDLSCLGFPELFDDVNVGLSANLGNFQPLCFQIFLCTNLSLLSWGLQ